MTLINYATHVLYSVDNYHTAKLRLHVSDDCWYAAKKDLQENTKKKARVILC